MPAPLLACTKEKQRSVVCFLGAVDVQGAEIHKRSWAQHVDEQFPTFYVCDPKVANGM
jgi:hypothetical protein